MGNDADIVTTQMQDRVQAILADVVRRMAAGEEVPDEAVLAAHSDLADQLRAGLQRLRLIRTAGEKAQELGTANTITFSPEPTPPIASGLAIRCPHCQEQFETAFDTPLAEIACESCGKRFNLVGTGTETRDAAALASLGHFELLERIGIGGFGTVWKGRDRKLDRIVAIKVPRRGSLDSADMDKFLREARAAAQLNHPHIVSVYEVGRDGDLIFIVSEYVRGMTLEKWLSRQRPTIRQAVSQCIFVAEALHHAHEQGVVHRDLKPGNIIIAMDGRPRVMDFGMARRVIGEVTMTLDGQLLGTPTYMSPEQALGKGHEADRRSDVYSLGVILFEMLTGERPFRGEYIQLIDQVVHDDPPSPRILNGSVAKDLETIALKCLEKEPGQRYQTAGEMAEELRRFLRGEAILARPIRRPERVVRWARRQPLLAAMCGAAAVLLVASLATTVELWRSRGDLSVALTAAEEQTTQTKRLKDMAQQREREAKEALEKLMAETDARQKAEATVKAELERRLRLAEQVKQQASNLREREVKLKEETSGRVAAEAAAANLAKDRDRILDESDWLGYKEGLTEADRLLQAGDSAGALSALQQCPALLRAWEWYYLRELCRGLKPQSESMFFPIAKRGGNLWISPDAQSFIYINDRPRKCQIFATLPLRLVDEFRPQNSSMNASNFLVSRDGNWAIDQGHAAMQHQSLRDLSRKSRVKCGFLESRDSTAFSSDSKCLLVARDGVKDRSPAQLLVASVETGEVVVAWELKSDDPITRAFALIAGPDSHFAIMGSISRTGVDTRIWIFHAPDISRIPPKCIHTFPPLERDSPHYLNESIYWRWGVPTFSWNENQFLWSGEFRYRVLDLAQNTIVGQYDSDRNFNALAISPDGRRVLLADSEGILLRDVTTSTSIPRLKSLPWGTWIPPSQNTPYFGYSREKRSYGNFAINSNWSQCAGICDPIIKARNNPDSTQDQNVKQQPVYVWSIDRPVDLSDDEPSP